MQIIDSKGVTGVCPAALGCEVVYETIVRQMELIIGKTEGTMLGIQHAVRCGTAGGVWGVFHGLHPWLLRKCG